MPTRLELRVRGSKGDSGATVRAAGISFTILRPVVIYGEGEKGNFATVHRLSRLPIPLPP